MAASLHTNKIRYDFGWFLIKDSPESVTSFENWRKEHPAYKLTDTSRLGRTILMDALSYGNVAMVSHLVKLMDKKQINIWTDKGDTIFGQVHETIRKMNICKIMECAKIIIEAGGDVNLASKRRTRPLDALLDKCDANALPLIKLYIWAGAQPPAKKYAINPFYGSRLKKKFWVGQAQGICI